MRNNTEIINFCVGLMVKSVVLAAQFSGRVRQRNLKRLAAMDISEKDKEILFLRDTVDQLKLQISILQKGVKKKGTNNRYTLGEKLYILHYVETFQVARHRVGEYLGIARSTYYRWLRGIEEKSRKVMPANKTSAEIAALVWEIAKANTDWGRIRIANQLALLKIFIAGSTVRNVLDRPEPRNRPKAKVKPTESDKATPRSIPAKYPNHVWSIDMTMVYCWGLWRSTSVWPLTTSREKSWPHLRWKDRIPGGQSMPWNQPLNNTDRPSI